VNHQSFLKGETMAIEIVVESKLEKEEEREQFSSYLKQLCEKKQLKRYY